MHTCATLNVEPCSLHNAYVYLAPTAVTQTIAKHARKTAIARYILHVSIANLNETGIWKETHVHCNMFKTP
jgi:hypothetical protein